MEISQIAAFQVASTASLVQQQVTMAVMKKAADAQAQMAAVIAQQVSQANPQGGFSVYA